MTSKINIMTRVIGIGIALVGGLSGCSDMAFVGKDNLNPQKDPREDIVLTSVETQMTSGGVVLQQISGSSALFANTSNDLTIKDMNVTTFGDDRVTQSVTRADVGEVYLAADPSRNIGRRDMKFAGDVLYRNPNKLDQTTDSMQMRSDLILWNELDKKFISPGGYEMLLYPKGKPPIRQRGKGFEATQDLSRFVVKAGSVSTKLDNDPTLERDRLLAEFARLSEAAEAEANRPLNLPTRVAIPEIPALTPIVPVTPPVSN